MNWDPDAWRTIKDHYTIDEDHVVHGPVNFDDWMEWAITVEDWDTYVSRCIVGRTRIDGDCHVSTDFNRGVDMRLSSSGPPQLFETMVFGGKYDLEFARYSTWSEAEAGHAAMVAKVMAGVEEP